MTPAPDHLDEIINIELSRMERAVLERWMVVCLDAGETDHAEAIRQASMADRLSTHPQALKSAA